MRLRGPIHVQEDGRGGAIRTLDLLNPIQVRYQAAPRPEGDESTTHRGARRRMARRRRNTTGWRRIVAGPAVPEFGATASGSGLPVLLATPMSARTARNVHGSGPGVPAATLEQRNRGPAVPGRSALDAKSRLPTRGIDTRPRAGQIRRSPSTSRLGAAGVRIAMLTRQQPIQSADLAHVLAAIGQ